MKTNKNIITGLVIKSSRNIMTVCVKNKDGYEYYECRIKGKVLKEEYETYNPAAPGDWVTIECEKNSGKISKDKIPRAMVLSVEQRRNFYSRYNQKGELRQVIAANVDLILCICTPLSPPFRPRFIDRVLLQAEIAGIEAVIICNKIDITRDDLDVNERLEEYRRIGYKVLNTSAKTGEGLTKLRKKITGKISVLTGQSGIGKSSIINALSPELRIKEGNINKKYDRGIHTTTMPVMYDIDTISGTLNENTYLIDTPGMRRFIPDGIKSDEVINYMREFSPLSGKCSFGLSCSHRTEVGCKILEAVDAGVIHEDRYESFIRITDDLSKLKQNTKLYRNSGKENAGNN